MWACAAACRGLHRQAAAAAADGGQLPGRCCCIFNSMPVPTAPACRGWRRQLLTTSDQACAQRCEQRCPHSFSMSVSAAPVCRESRRQLPADDVRPRMCPALWTAVPSLLQEHASPRDLSLQSIAQAAAKLPADDIRPHTSSTLRMALPSLLHECTSLCRLQARYAVRRRRLPKWHPGCCAGGLL